MLAHQVGPGTAAWRMAARPAAAKAVCIQPIDTAVPARLSRYGPVMTRTTDAAAATVITASIAIASGPGGAGAVIAPARRAGRAAPATGPRPPGAGRESCRAAPAAQDSRRGTNRN